MKKCPFCAEEIKDEAIKCKYCKSNLNGLSAVQESEQKQSSSFRFKKEDNKSKEGLFLQTMNLGCGIIGILIFGFIFLFILAMLLS